jgi:hypothetical protein
MLVLSALAATSTVYVPGTPGAIAWKLIVNRLDA